MTAITISDPKTGSTASILPELGFNCFSFKAAMNGQMIEALWAEPEFGPGNRPSRSGIPILFPFAGRLRGTSYCYLSREYHVSGAQMNGDNVIHGFVINRPWRVVERS